jgi:hypothetical protein
MELLEISIYEVSGLVRSKRLRQGKDINGLNQISLALSVTS